MAANRNHEASLNVVSIICNLIDKDFKKKNPKHDYNQKNETERYFNDFRRMQYEYAGSKNQEILQMGTIDVDIAKQIEIPLFHERVHYWQVISSTIQQLHFVNLLDRINLAVDSFNGETRLICGNIQHVKVVDAEGIDFTADILECGFKDVVINPNWMTIPNTFTNEPVSHMPLYEMPTKRLRRPFYGYCGFMHFPESPPAVIPFTAINILESAAYISEIYYKEESIPVIINLDQCEDKRYLGVWECWRRMHEVRYSTEKELVLGFLASVDLAMGSDVINPTVSDSEMYFQTYSIPYRFGKIIYTSRNLPLLKVENGDIAKSISKFQNQVCDYFGWSQPEATLKKMASYLTFLLLQAYSQDFEKMGISEQKFGEMILLTQNDHKNNFESLKEIWELLRKAKSGLLEIYPIGKFILSIMLNATLHRINHPGEFAVPHIYSSKLTKLFGLPMILYNGVYYMDVSIDAMLHRENIVSISPIEARSDCLGIMSLHPLKDMKLSCGFNEELINCVYLQDKYECPLKTSTNTTRNDGIKCHWDLRAKHLKIPEVVTT